MDFNFIWVLIPIAAILARVVREWIKVRAQQQVLGSSASELQKEVDDLSRRERTLVERIENLEAIVVSQTWNAVTDKSLAPTESELRLASVARREMAPPPLPDSEKAEVLARRLKA
jgi:uncharacterized protein YlxW (UPF0749 family)